jgi:transposase-like protein
MEKPRKGKSQGRIPLYEDSFKIAVARDYILGSFSASQVANKYGLNADNVFYFAKWYKRHHPDPSVPAQLPDKSVPPDTAGLEEELAMARLKITALEMLIRNAEREMGTDIIKKPGAKPSDR